MKKFAVSYIFIFLSFLILLGSCDKKGYKELEGTWIEEMDQGIKDGKSYVVYKKFKFDEDEVTFTGISEVEGEVVQAVTCKGEWKFIDEKHFDDKKAKGIVEIEYDLSTFRIQDYAGDVEENRKMMMDYFKSQNERLEISHKLHKYYGAIVTDIKKNVITFTTPEGGTYQWIRADYYEEYAMVKATEERMGNIPIEEVLEYEYNEPETENEVKTKKSGPSPLFLEHAIADYYECVFDDSGEIFYLTFFPENGRGAYQTSSGKVYLLSITHQNDTGEKLTCQVETLNEKKTNMEFDINITFYPDMTGKFIVGSDVYDFMGDAHPYEMP